VRAPKAAARPVCGPLRWRPVLVEKPWGGRRLETVFGRRLPAGKRIGESWELSGLREALTPVASGPFRGADVYRIARGARGEEVFGAALLESCRREFPLLVKFIDASDVLSVQVHPGDELARARGFPNGKSEAWVVVSAETGSCVYRGFRDAVGRNEFREALDSGSPEAVERCLERVEVAPGDVIDLPAGVVHAIGRGLLLCEVQQSSDLTYRVYDWGRTGLDGKPRPLHLAEAWEAMSFAPAGPPKAAAQRRTEGALDRAIFRDSYPFHLELASAAGAARVGMLGDRFEIASFLSGRAELSGPSGRGEDLQAGDTVLVPASWGEYFVTPAQGAAVRWVRSWAL